MTGIPVILPKVQVADYNKKHVHPKYVASREVTWHGARLYGVHNQSHVSYIATPLPWILNNKRTTYLV